MSLPPPLAIPYVPVAGRHLTLEPLAEVHKEDLRAACEADQDIWDVYPYSMAGEHFDAYWEGAMGRAAKGVFLPFAVVVDGVCGGVTCHFPSPPNLTTEIGGTYYRPDLRGSAVNPESKLMMIGMAFDAGARRVGFKVDALNARSRAAVLKLGARQDGILRQDTITWTGRTRDTVVFSILSDEWPMVRAGLDARLAALH
jgi:RimJ/RimL family protein N-acetyltransferase